jgi:hypothetical protein
MPQAPEPRPGPAKSKHALFWGLGLLGLALALYVLSSGPALRMAQQRKISTQALETVYGPLMTAMEVVPGCGWIKSYMDLWALDDKAMGVGN